MPIKSKETLDKQVLHFALYAKHIRKKVSESTTLQEKPTVCLQTEWQPQTLWHEIPSRYRVSSVITKPNNIHLPFNHSSTCFTMVFLQQLFSCLLYKQQQPFATIVITHFCNCVVPQRFSILYLITVAGLHFTVSKCAL